MRELKGTYELSNLAEAALHNSLRGKNSAHQFEALFRQSVYNRQAGSGDVEHFDHLAHDSVMR